jgi:molybdenum cofactor biosynthesis enzyme MoaA
MLHPDFQEISEFVRAKVENFRIITNGALLRRYQECVARNFDSVLVSLHGNEQTHDSITRTVGAHKRAIS